MVGSPALFPGHQVGGKAGQPVFAGVVATGDMRQALFGMHSGGGQQHSAGRVIFWQGQGYSLQAPGPADVQSVEVDYLRVRAV